MGHIEIDTSLVEEDEAAADLICFIDMDRKTLKDHNL